MSIKYQQLLATAILSFAVISSCYADWKVNPTKSHFSYISVKNHQIAELNFFKSLSGEVTSNGEVAISIDMASIETGVSIRNERIKEHLFHTASFPTTEVLTQIDGTILDQMKIGTTKEMPLTLNIKAIGQMKSLPATVIISRLTQSDYLIFNKDILVINAADFDKTGGLAKLQELAKLNAIEPVIPMSFQLYIEKP